MLKLALSVVVAAGLAAPALAQDQFPDVPDNHWAYEALKNLKDRVLFGYPDKLYRGSRPLSRYEFAVAINQLWQLMSGRLNSLEDQIKTLNGMIDGMGTGDMQGLRDQLNALSTKLEGVEKGQAELQRLVKEFETELSALGVNVDEMKRSIADLDARVRKLEAVKPTVALSGDVNFLVLGGASDNGRFGLTQSGRRVGVGKGSYAGNAVGISRDLNVLHEAAITLSGTNETGPKWRGTFVLGNLFDGLGNYNSPGLAGTPFNDTTSSLHIHELSVNFDSSVFGQGFNAMIGRIGYQISPYLFKRTDYTPFYANERWDNGNFTLDGGVLSFNFGRGKLNIVGGRNNPANFSGSQLNPIAFGTGTINRTLGADLMLPLADNVEIRGAYLIHDSDTIANLGGPANRVTVYGGELKAKFGDVKLTAAAAKTPITENNSKRLDSKNTAYDVNLAFETDRVGLSAGYRQIERNFAAAGSWGRVGLIWNPTDVQGFNVKGRLKVSDDLQLHAAGEFLEGKDGSLFAIGKDDDLTSFMVGLDYRLNPAVNLTLGYEDVKMAYRNNPPGFGDPTQRWYTLGLGWSMSDAAKVSFMYQLSDIDFKGWPFGASFGDASGRYKGSLLGTQISIKF
jgi:archaellum component FlaC